MDIQEETFLINLVLREGRELYRMYLAKYN